MGWARGSQLAEDIWKEFQDYIKPKEYKRMATFLVEKFCEYDADDWELYPSDECLYYVYLKHNHPEELKEYDFD